MFHQFISFTTLLGDAIQEIVDRYSDGTHVLALIQLEIVRNFLLHIYFYIDADRFFLKKVLRYAKDDGSPAVKILVFAAGAAIR